MRMRNLGGMDTECVTHDDMVDLYSIEQRLLQVGPLLESFVSVLEHLSRCFVDDTARSSSSMDSAAMEAREADSWMTTLSQRRDLMLSYQTYVSALLRDCASTSSLLAGLLDLRNHSSVLDLSRSTVVMSAIFLVYLSSTAVAVSCPKSGDKPHEETNAVLYRR